MWKVPFCPIEYYWRGTLDIRKMKMNLLPTYSYKDILIDRPSLLYDKALIQDNEQVSAEIIRRSVKREQKINYLILERIKSIYPLRLYSTIKCLILRGIALIRMPF